MLKDAAALLGWMHVMSAASTFDSTLSCRASVAQLFPSPGDMPVTAAQERHLSTLNFANRYNTVHGAHNIKIGADIRRFPLNENFSFGVTNPAFNDPASGGYIPGLTTFDLSRGGHLFHFRRRLRATFTARSRGAVYKRTVFTFQPACDYRFLVDANQLQPRLEMAFHIKETGAVLRASYNRLFQTPPNENLLISNSEESSVLVDPGARQTLGGALVRIRPERQDAFDVGPQQALANRASLNVACHHKRARDQQDNDNFFNTGIIFPISLSQLRVNGMDARLTTLPIHGFSSIVSLTHSHAVVTPPFTGGLFIGNSAIDALNAGAFVIDHDQKLSVQATARYSSRRGFWANVDAAVGYECKRGERRVWELSFEVANLANKRALYNFQSIFVGARLVGPRSAGARLRWYW